MTVRVNKDSFNLREKLSELERPIGLKGSELLRAETAQDARDLVSAGRKNILHNGAMQIAQRGTSATTGSGSTAAWRVCDRWMIRNANCGVFTITQETDGPPGFGNSIKWECTTADASPGSDDFLYMQQGIEGYNVQQLKKGTSDAQYSVFSFWVKSSEVGIFTVQIYDQVNGRGICKRYTIDSADTWEYKSLLIPPDTSGSLLTNDNGARYYFMWWLASGTSRTTGSSHLDRWNSVVTSSEASGQTGNIASSIGSYIQFTGVQYEVGKNATEFEHRSYGEELALCQRYYFKSTNGQGTVYGDTRVGLSVPFPVRMRTTPTITLPTSVSNNVHNFGLGDNSYTTGGNYGTNEDGGRVYLTGGTQKAVGTFSVLNSNAPIEFSAEL